MRKPVRYGIAATLVVALLIAVAWSRRNEPPDPVYQGKRLSVWMQAYDRPSTPIPDGTWMQRRTAAVNAVRQLGTNAIPRLLWMLQLHDSPFRSKLIDLVERQHVINLRLPRARTLYKEAVAGMAVLESGDTNILTELIQLYDHDEWSGSRQEICSLFYTLGTRADAAAPSIARRLMTSPNNTERSDAINTLRRIKAQPAIVVPALINALQDPSLNNQADAAYTLAIYGTNAASAVGPLIALLNDPTRAPNEGMPFVNIPSAVQFALERIDPAAAAKIFGPQK